MEKDYKVIKKLGEGGFGDVYLIEKKCALKKFNKILKEEEKDKIKNMINIINKINNEHIIKYYDIYEENNIFNVLMEYGGDINLKQYIENQKGYLIEENIIKDIILQICIGLKEIHKNNIIHRDLTPDNIFINKNNKIKIGDFGISKISKEYANTQIGKHHYFAPEIEKGNKYNNKIDIYSLGCIIYELLTLNEYYIDTVIDKKDGKININIYNPKWQKLIDLLLQKDYNKRPNIDTIYNYIKDEIKVENNENIDNNNYIISEIDINDNNIGKDIRIINSYEECLRENTWMKKDNKYNNEEEIKKCEIKINDELIPFNYKYKFNSKGKYKIKYSFKNNLTKTNHMFCYCELLTNINLSNFNTNNVTNMGWMFCGCSSLILL